jgi:quinol monooxygenase YgiN
MISIIFSVTVRPEAEDEFRRIVELLTQTTHAEDTGCEAYTFLRQSDNSLRHVLFEQWTDQDSLNAHIARLQQIIGPADTDEAYPESHFRRRLPKAFLDLFSETQVQRYEVVV